ncbi:MAG: type II toxin-antitoxin system RelE/ParE family toxin [Planctomycetota bacterium]
MPRFHVEITERAALELVDSATWWSDNRSPEQAELWYNEISRAINGLAEMPRRCPLVYGHDFGREVRVLLFGVGSRATHRIFFAIDGERVVVLRVRHTAQADLTDPEVL